MKCPKCGTELVPKDVNTIFGIREGVVDILAEGEMQVAFCCGTAVLFEKQKQPAIITPPQEIILP